MKEVTGKELKELRGEPIVLSPTSAMIKSGDDILDKRHEILDKKLTEAGAYYPGNRMRFLNEAMQEFAEYYYENFDPRIEQPELSVCCGAERLHPDMDLCSACRDHTSFERADSEFWEKEAVEAYTSPIKAQVRRAGRIPLKDLWQIDWNECEVVKATTKYIMVVERLRNRGMGETKNNFTKYLSDNGWVLYPAEETEKLWQWIVENIIKRTK